MTTHSTAPEEPVTQRIERVLDQREIAHDRRVGDKFFAVLQQLLIPLLLGLISALGGLIVVGISMREDISLLRHDYQTFQTTLATLQIDLRALQKDNLAVDHRLLLLEPNGSRPSSAARHPNDR